jgi:hypothetical protein
MSTAPTLGISTLAHFPYTARHSLKGGDRMDFVVAQMIVTGVLLLAFSVEVLVGKLVWD